MHALSSRYIPASWYRKRKVSLFIFTVVGIGLFFFAFFRPRELLNQFQNLKPYDDLNCGCPRYAPPIAKLDNLSLCGDWSTSRGGNQRVIAYTIFGEHTNKKILTHYYNEIEDRIKEANYYYKGWIVRLYHNANESDGFTTTFLCQLYCKYSNFDPCRLDNILIPDAWFNDTSFTPYTPSNKKRKTKKLKNFAQNLHFRFFDVINRFVDPLALDYEEQDDHRASVTNDVPERANGSSAAVTFSGILIGKLWRFLPMGDEYVSTFLVRDVDSFLLQREVDAVMQWLNSSTALVHAMRDHPSHNGVILAGMWGAARWRNSAKMLALLKHILRYPPRDLWDYDQIILQRLIWPNVKNDILVHDSYHCTNPFLRAKHRTHPFPTKREGKLFVSWGRRRSHSEIKGLVPCPVECRPKNHQDWDFC